MPNVDPRSESGSSLLAVLMLAPVIAILGGAIAWLSAGEAVFSARHRESVEARFAVGAALERAVADLRDLPDWSPVLGELVESGFIEHEEPRLADGTQIDLTSLDARLQQRSDAASRWGADSPTWVRFAWGRLDALVTPESGPPLPLYLVVWVADDGLDGDGDPLVDSNGVIQLRAEVLGPLGRRRSASVMLARIAPGLAGVRRVSWSDEG